jgi:hypothetical protein
VVRGQAHPFLLKVVARVIGMNFNSDLPAQGEARRQVLSRALDTRSERLRNRAAASRGRYTCGI